jgi:hypothetical protein
MNTSITPAMAAAATAPTREAEANARRWAGPPERDDHESELLGAVAHAISDHSTAAALEKAAANLIGCHQDGKRRTVTIARLMLATATNSAQALSRPIHRISSSGAGATATASQAHSRAHTNAPLSASHAPTA